MEKYPRNNAIRLGSVANNEGIGKSLFGDLLDRVNELHPGDLVESDIYSNYIVDLSAYRSFKLTLYADVTIVVTGLDRFKEGYILIDPTEYTCNIVGVVKEYEEDTTPYNMTLYNFYSPVQGVVELKRVARNLYGINPGEFNYTEFDGEFII